MSACPCGGVAVRGAEVAAGLKLSYRRCPACGRCGLWWLSRGGVVVATGEVARRRYRDETRGNSCD